MNLRTSPFPRWLCIGAVLAVISACGADPNDTLGAGAASAGPAAVASSAAQTVNGFEKEWLVAPAVKKVKAGQVTFIMKNEGSLIHEMLIVRTDLPDGAIPIGDDDKFNEDAKDSKSIGEIAEYESGKSSTVTLKMKAGEYQLVCNVPGHYAKGMHTDFTVTA